MQPQIDFCLKVPCESYEDFIDGFRVISEGKINVEVTGRDISKWMTEILFESIRRKKHSQLPSRMKGIFLVESVNGARVFRNKYREGNGKIYSCHIPDEAVYSFDMAKFTCIDEKIKTNYYNNSLSKQVYEDIINEINEYWGNSN